jgi:hypothetical protein
VTRGTGPGQLRAKSSDFVAITRKLAWAVYLSLIGALFAVEAAFYADPAAALRRCTGIFWVLCSVMVLMSALVCAFSGFFGREFWTLPSRAWYIVAFFLPPILILGSAGGIYFTHVDSEGLEQLADGIKLLVHDHSLGVYRLGYFSYPARQYVLNSLPTYFFGPSLWAARVGNSMFYIGSYLFFLAALARFLRSRGNSDPLLFSGYCGIMIALGQYALLNAREFWWNPGR